jgi:superfamily II DNA or RNA helicase
LANIKIARNAVAAKLIDPPPNVANFVTSLLSYEVESGGFGSFSGKSSFFNAATGTFPAGFLNVVQAELTKLEHTVHIIQKPHAEPLGPENPIVDEFGNDDPRYDFQIKALRQVEKHGAGIIRVATGGGKSKIAKLIMARYRRMTLFLTTRGILLYQMKDQLDDIGFNSGVIGDSQMKVVRGINLGMVQTLVQALEEPSLDVEHRAVVKSIHTAKDKDENMPYEEIAKIAQERFDKKVRKRNAIIKFLSMVEVVIGEEAHEVGGTSYYEILRHCKNATIRVALTATPFMRSSAADNMRLMAAFGPVLIDVSEDLLISRGILAKPYFKFADVEPHEKLRKSSPYERALKFGFTENPNMHAEIVKDCRMAATYKLPTLLLVARKNHGELLRKVLKTNGLRFEFLRGEDDMKNRKAQIQKLVSGELDGIIGTTILDVGVDVPAVGLVGLCGGGKAEVALRQRIGRGLRAKKKGPNIAFIADYSCNLNTYLREHQGQRKRIVQRTPGFAEGILPDGQDFDWSLFSEAKAA